MAKQNKVLGKTMKQIQEEQINSSFFKSLIPSCIKSVKLNIEYEKSLNDLQIILGHNDLKDVYEVISWFRNEFTKLPNKYPGDSFVIEAIKPNLLKGDTLSMSLHKAFHDLIQYIALTKISNCY